MRLLVLTHTFPPSRHSNAKRPFYLVKGFLDAGWQVDVVTSPLGRENPADSGAAQPGLRVFCPGDPTDQLRRATARNPFLYRAAVLATSGLMWPDTYVWWAMKALRYCRRQPAYDRVLTFILPASLLLTARRPEFQGARLTFDFQESVTPQYRLQQRRSPLQKLLLPRLAQLERDALHYAGHVVFTADTNRRAYVDQGLVPENVTAHIPYFYDAEVFRQPANRLAEGLEIAYFGTFDWRGARSPETFLRALARFLGKHPEARPHTRFRFYGAWLPEHNAFLDELKLRDVAAIHPPISYAAYLEKLKQSPVLLLVVASAHNLFMPSKIVDYFGARRPIMAFVPRDSEMRHVLDQAGMSEFTCGEHDQEGGVVALETLWRRYQNGTLSVSAEKTRFWSSEVQIPRYVSLLTGTSSV